MLASKGLMASSAVEPIYVDDVFSTYLYTGTGASQTITNGIDLAGEGGMLWLKSRSISDDHATMDSAQGLGTNTYKYLMPNLAAATSNVLDRGVSQFNTNGFTLSNDSNQQFNGPSNTYASWTFRKAPKFFDVVTYTGNGATNRQINHNLGSAPGMVIAKCTNTTSDWFVWHRSLAGTNYNAYLNDPLAAGAYTDFSSNGSGAMNSTSFCVNGSSNINGNTYVAYLFAHDAGGFGESGTDNAVSCGSYTGNGSASGPIVTLGYEPQWVMIKNASADSQWMLLDSMRGIPVSGNTPVLYPNSASAEDGLIGTGNFVSASSTGFIIKSAGDAFNNSGNTYIYMAIRRPNKPPTIGTEVFSPTTYTGTNVDNRLVNTGILTDMTMARIRATTSTGGFYTADRLRGNASLGTAITDAENTDADSFMTPTVGYGNSFSAMNGFGVGNDATRQLNQSSTAQLAYAFKRAPGFFDVVCYTGNGTTQDIKHNLGVVPELIIQKGRSQDGYNWIVRCSYLPNNTVLYGLNTTAANEVAGTDFFGNNSAYVNPTATTFTIGNFVAINTTGSTYVAYLFATLPGVSKVGIYTGTGTTLQINCGFTTGARFVMIKRTDSTGNWYVWDTARGIVSGNDPYFRINLSFSETTGTDYIDPLASGFEISSTASTDINASGGSYIFLAIA